MTLPVPEEHYLPSGPPVDFGLCKPRLPLAGHLEAMSPHPTANSAHCSGLVLIYHTSQPGDPTNRTTSMKRTSNLLRVSKHTQHTVPLVQKKVTLYTE